MRLAIISDTHMPRHAKQWPAELLRGLEGVDLIIHGGDWQTLDVYHALKELAFVEGVSGNVDDEEIYDTLPEQRVLDLEGFRIGIVHGHKGPGNTTPERARRAFADEEPDLIVFGHSHIPYDEVMNGVRLFNPGSPTDKRRQPSFSYGLLDLGDEVSLRHIYYKDKS